MGPLKLNYEPLVTASLAKQIAEKIRESIADGTLKADDQLPTEDKLAQQFGVSRPTIREALKRLAAQSLIRSRRGPAGGTFINRPTREEVSSNLTTATALLVSLGEFEHFCASDVRFHRALADAAHNPILQFVMFAVIEALQPIENMLVFRFRERNEIVKQHEKMLVALKARDIKAAVAAVTEQTAYLRERCDAAQEWRNQQAAS